MRLKQIIPAALISMAAGVSAQNGAGINLSLWKDISTQRFDTTKTTYLNIGILSTMNRLNGIGVNVIGSAVNSDVNGVQISGLANLTSGGMCGIQASAITNINGDNMAGLSVTGLVNIAGNNANGVVISGLTNITGNKSSGLAVSGIMNINGDDYKGVSVAGLANVTGGANAGLMASGLLNLTSGNAIGLQIAALGNVVADTLKGFQMGILNYATNVWGVQIGLLNYSRTSFKGVRLGLVNLNPDTRIQMMLFGGNATKLNVAARFRNKLFYTIVGAGSHYLDFDDKFSASFFYRCGLWHTVYKSLSVSGDLGYQHIETFRNKHNGIPPRLYGLQARVNLEYQFTDKFGVFASGGYGGSRYYNKNVTYDKGAIAEVGILLF